MALISYWPQSTSKLTSKSPSSPTPSVADFKVAFQVDLTPKFPSGFLFKSIEFEICRFQLNFQLKFEWVGGGGRVGAIRGAIFYSAIKIDEKNFIYQ